MDAIKENTKIANVMEKAYIFDLMDNFTLVY